MACWGWIVRPHTWLYLWLLTTIHFCCAVERPLSSIDAEAFGQRAQSPSVFVVSFCMPSFEPCKSLNTELISAGESLARVSKVDFYEFDCSKDLNFCTSLEVFSFPTIRIFEGQEWARYRGPQKGSSIVSHVLKRVLDPVVQLDEHQLSNMKTLDLPLLLLTCGKNDEYSMNAVRSLAQKELSGRFFVGITTTSVLDTVEAGAPSLSVFNRFDEAEPAYQGPFDRTSLLEFVGKVSEPLIRQLDLPNLVNLMQSGIPLAMIFSANKDERRAISKDLAGLALKYRNLVNFVTVDAEKHSFLLGHFGLHMHSLPAFVIQTPDDVFPLNPVSEIRFDTVDGFIRQVVPGL